MAWWLTVHTALIGTTVQFLTLTQGSSQLPVILALGI